MRYSRALVSLSLLCTCFLVFAEVTAQAESPEKLRDLKNTEISQITDMKSTDQDTGITWIKSCGKGRLFYCGLGHNNPVFWNTPVLEHFLLGIQFAAGDYDVPSDGGK